jgi:hypothetical protein
VGKTWGCRPSAVRPFSSWSSEDPYRPEDLGERPVNATERSRARTADVLSHIVLPAGALTLVLLYARIYFGVDLGDESYAVAVPYRFALGARPFVDEVSVAQQGPGLLLYPFVYVYYRLVGTTGMFLFMRHLYFLFAGAVSVSIFLSLRVFLKSELVAVSAALLALAFVPANTYTLNYNSLGAGLFAMGCFAGLAYTRRPRYRYLVGAGLAHGLAVFAYPALALGVVGYLAVLYLMSGRKRQVLVAHGVVAAIPALIWLAVLLSDGITNARAILSLASGVRASGLARAEPIVRTIFANFPYAPLGLLATVWAFTSRRAKSAAFLLALLPVFALPTRVQFHSFDSGIGSRYVINYGLLALPLAYALRVNPLARRLFIVVWVPSLVAGCGSAWASTTPGGSAQIGFFPAVFVTTILLLLALREVARKTRTWLSLPATSFAMLAPVAILLALQWSATHFDGRPFTLTHWVARGPFAGLVTSAEKQRYLYLLAADLKPIASPSCGILFYYNFPAGYLLTSAVPETNAAWLLAREPQRSRYRVRLLSYYRMRNKLPDIAVRMISIPSPGSSTPRPTYLPSDPLDQLIRGRLYRQVEATPEYAIYVRRASACDRPRHDGVRRTSQGVLHETEHIRLGLLNRARKLR